MTRIIFDNDEQQVLTIKEDSAFPLTRNAITTGVNTDRSIITDRLASGSRTVTIDGSKENIQVLGALFDVNVIDGSFDINAKQPCYVEQAGVNVFPNAYFQIKKVKIRKARLTSEVDQVSFEGIVYNNVASLFKDMGNAELTDLKLGSPDNFHTLDLAAIIGSLSNTPTEGYVYPTMYKGQNVYQVNEFKPAIFFKAIFDAIHETYGYTYEWSSLTDQDVKFDKIISPTVDKFIPTDEQIAAESVNIGTNLTPDPDASDASSEYAFTQLTFPAFASRNASGAWCDESGNIVATNPYPNATNYSGFMQIISQENLDPKGQYNTTTGVFTANLTSIYDFDFTVNFEVDLQVTADAEMEIPLTNGKMRYNFSPFVVHNQGTTAYDFSGQSMQFDFIDGDTLTSGSNLYTGTYKGRITLNLTSGDTVDLMGFLLKIEGTTSAYWKDGSGDLIDVEPNLTAESVNVNITPRIEYQEGITIDINAFLPKKVKQSDFVKSVYVMFNLIPIQDPDDERNIILYKRDDYYNQGTQRYWSKKLAVDRDFEIEFLPNVNSKSIELSYKDDKDLHNTSYLESIRKTYGQLRYTFENQNTKGVDRKELIFSPTPCGYAAFGGVTPFIPLFPEGLNIRALLWNGAKDAGYYYYIKERDGTLNQISQYGQANHMDDALNPSYDLNFGVCDYYFYQGINITVNNLFNLNYRRLFKQLNDGKRGIGYFDLSVAERAQLQLNDMIYINNSWWIIEKVEEDANNETLTKVTLLSIDDEVSIKPVRRSFNLGNDFTLPTVGQSDGNTGVVLPNSGVNYDNGINSTIFGGDNGRVIIEGEGNIIQAGAKNVKVFGNNNKVSASDVFIIGDNIVAEVSGTYVGETKHISGQVVEQIYEIGSWNMDSTPVNFTPHGIDNMSIRGIDVIIQNDTQSNVFLFTVDRGTITFDATNITLSRVVSDFFDNTNFDDETINRGWITLKYIQE